MFSQNEILTYIKQTSTVELAEAIHDIHPADFLEALNKSEENPLHILEKLPNDYIALLIDQAEDDEKFDLLSLFSERRKGHIISEMSSDELVDLIGNLDEENQDEIILLMDDAEAKEVKALLSYPSDSAGGIMATEFISVKENMRVDELIEYLRNTAPDSETPYYLYVLDEKHILKGIVPLRDVLISPPDALLRDIMVEKVITIPVDLDQEEVGNRFEKYGFMAMPVVDANGVMLGIVTVDDVMEIIQEEHTEDLFRLAGLDGEEKISGSVKSGIQSRLPWLLVNLVTAILAAATVSLFEKTIAQIVALATFMPIVAGMGGNAGTQTLTMIIRGIALGELTYENQKEILGKEFAIGIVNGLALGVVVAVLGYYWVGNLVFGLVIGLAMLLNLIIASVSGFFVPLGLKKIGVDPALASAVFVTTVTDVLGFFFFLGLATLMINFLI
jgi:magnesium transporter